MAETVLACLDGRAIGFAVFFHSYSTFSGRAGLYLEDLFVEPSHRRNGYGKALLLHIARLAVERGCERMVRSVLDWNTSAIESTAAWVRARWTTGPSTVSGARPSSRPFRDETLITATVAGRGGPHRTRRARRSRPAASE
jgi:GNAT superfamily N-acetyltransferase